MQALAFPVLPWETQVSADVAQPWMTPEWNFPEIAMLPTGAGELRDDHHNPLRNNQFGRDDNFGTPGRQAKAQGQPPGVKNNNAPVLRNRFGDARHTDLGDVPPVQKAHLRLRLEPHLVSRKLC